MADPRRTLIGIHPTGAKFYLEPFSNGKAGNRRFVIEGSRMSLPASLEGMWVDTASAIRAFEAYLASGKGKRSKSGTVTDAEQ